MRDAGFIISECLDRSQKGKNEHFYKMLGYINQHCAQFNYTYEKKEKLVNELVRKVGYPKKLNIFQKLFT